MAKSKSDGKRFEIYVPTYRQHLIDTAREVLEERADIDTKPSVSRAFFEGLELWIEFYGDDEVFAKLDQISEITKKSHSEVVRLALNSYLKQIRAGRR
jgi:hypothetical protein